MAAQGKRARASGEPEVETSEPGKSAVISYYEMVRRLSADKSVTRAAQLAEEKLRDTNS